MARKSCPFDGMSLISDTALSGRRRRPTAGTWHNEQRVGTHDAHGTGRDALADPREDAAGDHDDLAIGVQRVRHKRFEDGREAAQAPEFPRREGAGGHGGPSPSEFGDDVRGIGGPDERWRSRREGLGRRSPGEQGEPAASQEVSGRHPVSQPGFQWIGYWIAVRDCDG